MTAHSSEVVICFACDVASCAVHENKRVMKPYPINGVSYAEIEISSGDVCPGIVAEAAKSRNYKDLGDDISEVQSFISFLYLLGLSRVAEEYSTISSSTELVVHLQPQDRTLDESIEVGKRSEARLFELLQNKDLFPWVADIVVAPKNNARYDFTLLLQQDHPIAMMLNCTQIYIDSKSSAGGVRRYYKENTRKQNVGANQSLLRDKKLWAINANESATDQVVFAQIVTCILISVGKLNQPGHWESVFNKLSTELVHGFNAEISLVLEYAGVIMQELLRPEVEAQLKQLAETFAQGLLLPLPVSESIPAN